MTTDGATTITTDVRSTCGTVIGCNAQGTSTSTSTTASSTPTGQTHVVFPKDGNDQSQIDQIAAQLQKFVNSPTDLKDSTTETFGLNFWLLPVTEGQAEEIRGIPNVSWLCQVQEFEVPHSC